MPAYQWLHLGKVEPIIFADNLLPHICAKWQAAMLAVFRAMIFVRVRRLGQNAGVSLMTRFGPTGP